MDRLPETAELAPATAAAVVRLGMITPSSNTVLEPLTQAILAPLFPEISVHFQRFRVTSIGPSETSFGQFDQANLLAAAALLADAKVQVVAWSGTSGSWLGIAHDRRLVDAIGAACGASATTSVLALEEALHRLEVRRLGLVTPYMAEIQRRIITGYGARGIAVVAEEHLEESGNFGFATHGEATIARLVRAVAARRPDAIAVLCTNLRGARIAPALEAELGIPVLDSVSVTVWKSLALAGVASGRIRGWGRLFDLPPLSSKNQESTS